MLAAVVGLSVVGRVESPGDDGLAELPPAAARVPSESMHADPLPGVHDLPPASPRPPDRPHGNDGVMGSIVFRELLESYTPTTSARFNE